MLYKLASAVLPPPASTFAKDTDWMFYFITWVSVFFFVLIVALMLYFMVKYKRKSEDDVTPNISHNLVLEVIWSVVPIIIVCFMFYWGYKDYARMNDSSALFEEVGPDGKYIDLYVTGKQWSWDISYPNGIVVNSRTSLKLKEKQGLSSIELDMCEDLEKVSIDFEKDGDVAKAVASLTAFSTGKYKSYAKDIDKVIAKLPLEKDVSKQRNLLFNIWARITNFTDFVTVPFGVPVRLNMTANDVIHSFAVPSLRIKKDVIKNRAAVIWFNGIELDNNGTYIYTCNEMCGVDHSAMIGYLRIVPYEEYQKYLKAIAGPMDPWDLGKKIYEGTCSVCHSIDGSGGKPGPTWKDLWGKKDYEMSDGSKITVDKDYIKESIVVPNAKKAKKFAAAAMPEQNLTSEQLEAVIKFIESPNNKPEN
jgi:heme/copper-type cytochrome/quinol oxidase subunit 2